MTTEISQHGFSLIPGILDAREGEALLSAFGPVSGAGRRGLLAVPAIADLARSPRILDLIRPHLPVEPVPVRAIYFNKSPEANWLVSWHQDLTIALRARCEVPGFSLWTVKDGIPHAQPPLEFLEQMLTVRLHLDDTDDSNGALRVLPGSHRWGLLSSERIDKLAASEAEVLCAASAGDVLLLRPLLLHASGRSTSVRHRRVLHIEYAGINLPARLAWHEGA